ncbi:MAG: LacI family DNA-binding transcriptional regulator [Trueperaceae bacterium]
MSSAGGSDATVHASETKVTLADVARRAGVSNMTVSRVVNDRPGVGEETRNRVRSAIAQLGYRPNIVARGLKARRSRTIGLLVPDVTNPYFPEIVRGAEDVAIRHGFTLLLTNVIEDAEREASALEAFEDRRVDGVIAASPRLTDDRLHPLLARHAAAVIVNRRSDPDVAGSVRIDHEHGARMAIRHLAEVGRTRMAVLAGPTYSHAGRERLLGADRETRERGLPLPDARIVTCPPDVDGGARSAYDLLSRDPEIDALLCFNDLVAAGALQAAKELGRRVPHDLSIIGYDDIVFARMFTPALSSIRAPTYELGRHAATMLFQRMRGRGRGVDIVLQPELIVRASTVPVPSAADRDADPPDATPLLEGFHP